MDLLDPDATLPLVYCDRCYAVVHGDFCCRCGRMWCCDPGPTPVLTSQPAVLPTPEPPIVVDLAKE